MSKHILVCLPISAEQRARIEAVQGFEYRFTTPDTARTPPRQRMLCGPMPCWATCRCR